MTPAVCSQPAVFLLLAGSVMILLAAFTFGMWVGRR